MTRYEKIAAKAVAADLAGRTEPVQLFGVSCVADRAARDAGKKRDLYNSLYSYPDLLPPGWRTQWLTAQGGSGDRLLFAVPPDWQPGTSLSRSLLLGGGSLVHG